MSLPIKFDQGLNTAKDVSDLDNGEMNPATGIFYKPGDMRAQKIGGVTTFGDTTSGKKVDGVALLQFDEGGTDKVVALSDRVLYSADIAATGDTGSLSTLKSGLGALATSLSAAQFNDIQFLALGSENLVVRSDGTTHEMGMRAPIGAPVGVAAAGTILIRADGDSSGFTDPGNAYDGGSDATDTYAHGILLDVGSVSDTVRWTATANSGVNRAISIKWAVSGFPVLPDFPSDGDFDDVGGTFDSGFQVKIKFEFSVDNGLTFTTFYDISRRRATGELYAEVDLADGQEIQDLLLVRYTLTYTRGNTNAALFIYDVNVHDGGTSANFTLDTGVFYGVSEFDETTGDEGPANYSKLVTMGAGVNHIKLTLPTQSNSRATHWNIYRTTDKGTLPGGLGYIDTKPIASTIYRDRFEQDKDIGGKPLYPLLRTVAQQDVQALTPLFFPQNSPPGRMVRLRSFQGSLVGLSAEFPRSLYYSMAAHPQKWPEINVIEAFPSDAHDELVDCVSLGSILLIAAQDTMLRLTSLPRVVNSVRDTSRVDEIKGAPGCVGRYALTTYSVAGEPHAAWISPYGVYITNGDDIRRISKDIDWSVFDGIDKTNWVLHWDAFRLSFVMFTSSVAGGSNDEYYLINMAPEHRKDHEQPKWSGPHPGDFHSLTSGQVGSTHRLYAGHVSDGSVYVLDRSVGTDSSESFNGTQLPLIIKSGRVYAEGVDWSAIDARLYHSDFGDGQTGLVEWEVDNDDEGGSSAIIPNTVSLAGNKGTQFDISTRCQWAQVTITHTGNGRPGAAIRDLQVEALARGRSGFKRTA